jgi:hypothetical protein
MRRNERARSTRKECPLRNPPLPRKQALAEIVFERDLDQSVGEQLGILVDAADALGLIDQGIGESPSQLAVLGTQQTALFGGLDKDLAPPDPTSPNLVPRILHDITLKLNNNRIPTLLNIIKGDEAVRHFVENSARTAAQGEHSGVPPNVPYSPAANRFASAS